jgi:divalent metal cation (Fe/Co/Zn/Cd) transporter
MDRGLPESVLGPVRQSVLEVQGVEGVHELRGRRMGSTIHLDVHIEVDPWLSVSAAHNIGDAVRQQVHKRHPNVTESFIHIGSYSTPCFISSLSFLLWIQVQYFC